MSPLQNIAFVYWILNLVSPSLVKDCTDHDQCPSPVQPFHDLRSPSLLQGGTPAVIS